MNAERKKSSRWDAATWLLVAALPLSFVYNYASEPWSSVALYAVLIAAFFILPRAFTIAVEKDAERIAKRCMAEMEDDVSRLYRRVGELEAQLRRERIDRELDGL